MPPTILNLVGVENPQGNWQDSKVEPIIGRDFSAFWAGDGLPDHDNSNPIGRGLGGNCALFYEDCKIVTDQAGQDDTN